MGLFSYEEKTGRPGKKAISDNIYILKLILCEERTEKTVFAYISHICPYVVLLNKASDPIDISLMYEILISDNNFDFVNSLLGIKGVKCVSLFPKNK